MSRTRGETAPQQLKRRLKRLGWNQTVFANELGVSVGIVSRWLTGERSPSLEMAVRIERSRVRLPAEAWVDSPAADGAE